MNTITPKPIIFENAHKYNRDTKEFSEANDLWCEIAKHVPKHLIPLGDEKENTESTREPVIFGSQQQYKLRCVCTKVYPGYPVTNRRYWVLFNNRTDEIIVEGYRLWEVLDGFDIYFDGIDSPELTH